MNSPKGPAQKTSVAKRDVDGILLLDKPLGITSNRALQKVKRLYQAKKAGHTGSLDPSASGMLPICFGQATKFSGFLLSASKTYSVIAQWGARTDTADADGKVVETSAIQTISKGDLERALGTLRGDIQQVPPMYSALKQDGKRLYDLARAGQEVPRPPRAVTIHALEIVAFDPRQPRLVIHCSKGTYIRSLVEDIAAACGTVGHVKALRRHAVEPFEEAALVKLDQLSALAEELSALDNLLAPVDAAIANWPSIELDEEQTHRLRLGQAVQTGGAVAVAATGEGLVRIYGPDAGFLGIGAVGAEGQLAPRRLLV